MIDGIVDWEFRPVSWIKNLGLLTISIGAGLICIEALSRYVMPVSPGVRNLNFEGEPVAVNTPLGLRLRKDLVYRQVANEFDVQVTIGKLGNRIPDPEGDPEVVFLGDSFTFGQGLEDNQTFPYIFCRTAKISCGNLGRSGTGTGRQLDIFQHYLDSEGWRPRIVKLFVFAMTGSLLSGNDFHDNYLYDLVQKRTAESDAGNAGQKNLEPLPPTLGERIIAQRGRLLEWSNLARFLYFSFGPKIKASFSPKPNSQLYSQARDATKVQLTRLAGLAERYGFKYQIYFLYPVQDLIRGTHVETASVLRAMVGNDVETVDTAEIFSDSPGRYYYSYDGHFNSAGSKRLAEYLLSAR